jgi:hypothetical protein
VNLSIPKVQFNVTPDDDIVYRNIYIESVSSVFVILNLVNPDFVIIMYHLQLTAEFLSNDKVILIIVLLYIERKKYIKNIIAALAALKSNVTRILIS